jgi:uncharacterized protein (TIGR02270 family)
MTPSTYLQPEPCPAVDIRPTLEVISSLVSNGRTTPLNSAWELLLREVAPSLRFRYDNRLTSRDASPLSSLHLQEILEVLHIDNHSGKPASGPEWTSVTLADQAKQECPPGCSLSCTFGPIEVATNQRGVAMRLTLSDSINWSHLAEVATQIAGCLEDGWRWITVGYSFVYVPWYSTRMGEALVRTKGLCRRFKGVDVGDIFGLFTSYWQRHPRTAQWLTLISQQLLPERQLEANLAGDLVTVRPIQKGWLIKAGDTPSKVDVNRQEDARAYMAADMLLAILRPQAEICSLPAWNISESKDWFERFKISTDDPFPESSGLKSVLSLCRESSQPILCGIIARHAVDAAILWIQRERALSSRTYDLEALSELDNRLFANIEGLDVAGKAGWEACREELEYGGAGELFAAAVTAFVSGSEEWISFVMEKVGDDAEMSRAIISALGWLSYDRAEPHIQKLLIESSPLFRRIGIAASAIHRVVPGKPLIDALSSESLPLRARALKAAGELGNTDLLTQVRASFGHEDTVCRFRAAWSAALLGDPESVAELKSVALVPFPHQDEAMKTAFRRMNAKDALSLQYELAKVPETLRLAAIGAGAIGDIELVPRLTEQMKNPKLARVAGEAFSMITGVDISLEHLAGQRTERFETGPADDTDDRNVQIDPDEDLPWPNHGLATGWWEKNKSRFDNGTRYLLGLPVNEENLQRILRTGNQRQRHAAALELGMMKPGQTLFEIRAPGYRQKKMLGLR